MPANQSALFLFWWDIGLKGAGGNFTPPVRRLGLGDYVRKPDVEYVILALYSAELVAADLFDANNDEGDYLSGDQNFDAASTVSRVIKSAQGAELRVRRTGTLDLSTLFGAGQRIVSPMADIQTLDGLSEYEFDAVTALEARFDSGSDASILDDVDTGDRFILAVYGVPDAGGDRLRWQGGDRLTWGSDAIRWGA